MPRDSKGRFLPRLGAKLNPDSAGDGKVVIVPPMSPPALDEDEWSFSMASLGLTIDLSAEHVCDAMRRQAIVDTREALIEGRRPDGKGAQKPLGARASSIPGRQSQHRGYKTGHLADHLRATKITGDSSRAKCRIVPPANRNVYVAQELSRGVALLTAAGAIGEGMRKAAARAVEAMCSGREVQTEDGEVEAEDV